MRFPPTHQLLTAEEFGEMPAEGQPYELVRGTLVVSEHPKPVHGELAAQIAALLVGFVRPRKLGRVTVESGYVTERGPDTVRGPDVAFVIRSPGDRPGELAEKVAEYLGNGASLVWGVDPRRRVVMVHTPDGHTHLLRDGDTVDSRR